MRNNVKWPSVEVYYYLKTLSSLINVLLGCVMLPINRVNASRQTCDHDHTKLFTS